MDKSVIAVYGNMEAAESAIKEVIEKGFPAKQLSIVAQNLKTEELSLIHISEPTRPY